MPPERRGSPSAGIATQAPGANGDGAAVGTVGSIMLAGATLNTYPKGVHARVCVKRRRHQAGLSLGQAGPADEVLIGKNKARHSRRAPVQENVMKLDNLRVDPPLK